MVFKVISYCSNKPPFSETECDFYLEEDGWNDYGYYTYYHLHATPRITKKDSNEYLGHIRIMRIGQQTDEKNVIRQVTSGKIFHELPEDFVSLSLDVSMFQHLRTYLTTKQRIELVDALKMIVSKDSSLLEKVQGDDCFVMSLLRDGASVYGFHMKQIESYMLGKSVLYNLRKETITVNFSHVDNSVELYFMCREDEQFNNYSSLGFPNGVVVFVGKNGSGKSTAMYKLARLIYSDPTIRFHYKEDLGEIKPIDIGVVKMMIFSYSPFDNFYLPGMNEAQLLSQLKNLNFEDCPVLFNGIRDVCKEMELSSENSAKDIPKDGRVDSICLKPNEALYTEFQLAIQMINSSAKDRLKLWLEFKESCRQSQQNLYEDIIRVFSAENELQQKVFANIATGHKFIIHSIARMIAYIEENSLVLFDEPENHLHPPLLSFYFSQIRKVIDHYYSVAFISTHSPVIVQETFAKNVNIVRRVDGHTSITHPQIETYGASISSITSEVFDLTTDVMNTYEVFNKVFDWGFLSYYNTPEKMLERAREIIGGEISGPMEAYLINLFFESNPDYVDS